MYLQNDNIDPVEGNDWYHGDITKQEAAEKLAKGNPSNIFSSNYLSSGCQMSTFLCTVIAIMKCMGCV